MHFFGVRTEGSSALKLFPAWAEVLGIKSATLVGIDLPLEATPAQYREAVYRLKTDTANRGALVTSHKLNVVRTAHDLFDEFTEDALLCKEVSAIYKREGRLIGHAADPVTSMQSMDHFLGTGYWSRYPQAEILSYGVGGATVAMVVGLLTQKQPGPSVVTLIDIDQERLRHLEFILSNMAHSDTRFNFVCNRDALENDRILHTMPAYSLIINATGMGKDRPGSPITDRARFPEQGAIWELNYRGKRRFLQQARTQEREAGLKIEDGWYYFLRGWSSVMSYVFDFQITPELFARFAEVSEVIRGSGPGEQAFEP